MCRLFGFRSVLDSQVHRSLVTADNALGVQSRDHPHGWGVAYYLGCAPHVVKSAASALTDKLFHRVSGIVTSQTVLAHVRRATQGDVTTINCHPFQYGRWTFAHNGNVRDFRLHREALLDRTPAGLRRFILGETDSEALFHLLLGHMARRHDVHGPAFPVDALADAARETVATVESIAGPLASEAESDPSLTYLTFIITDGTLMLAHQGGQPLHYSTHKTDCPERDVCGHWSYECTNPTRTGFVNHLIFASEQLLCENVWHPMALREMVAVDAQMRLHVWPAPDGRRPASPAPTRTEGDAYADGGGI